MGKILELTSSERSELSLALNHRIDLIKKIYLNSEILQVHGEKSLKDIENILNKL